MFTHTKCVKWFDRNDSLGVMSSLMGTIATWSSRRKFLFLWRTSITLYKHGEPQVTLHKWNRSFDGGDAWATEIADVWYGDGSDFE